MLERLTLIILSYERRAYMLRAMHYWSGRGPRVHVLDGSSTALTKGEMAGVQDNVHYHHRAQGLYSRLACAIPLIETEYCALVSDDEFYLTSGLEAAISWLDINRDYVACSGQVIRFWPEGEEIFWRNDYPQLKNYSVTDSEPLARMTWHMAHYVPSTIYAVARSDNWKVAMNILVSKEYPAYAIGELQFEAAMAFMGKTIALKEILWLRSDENEGVRRTDPSLVPERRFDTWWDSPEKLHERQEFLEVMSTCLAEGGGIERNRIKDGIGAAFEQYRNCLYKQKKLNIGITGRLAAAAKWRIYKLIHRKSYSPGGVWFRLDELLSKYEPQVSMATRENLEEILRLLMRFHYTNDA